MSSSSPPIQFHKNPILYLETVTYYDEGYSSSTSPLIPENTYRFYENSPIKFNFKKVNPSSIGSFYIDYVVISKGHEPTFFEGKIDTIYTNNEDESISITFKIGVNTVMRESLKLRINVYRKISDTISEFSQSIDTPRMHIIPQPIKGFNRIYCFEMGLATLHATSERKETVLRSFNSFFSSFSHDEKKDLCDILKDIFEGLKN